MNERIRELAEQALFESEFDDEQNIKITMDIFAELIVKSFLDIMENCNGDLDFAIWKTKQDFGVEE
jgi:molecular chaperone DnaK (HSP70)